MTHRSRPGERNQTYDIAVHDAARGRPKEPASARQESGDIECIHPSISADGRYVTFASGSRLVDGTRTIALDVFLGSTTGTTERLSVDSTGIQGTGTAGVVASPSMPVRRDGERRWSFPATRTA
jgi:hypothetical protein